MNARDRIGIVGLSVATHIGVSEEERATPQTLELNIILEMESLRPAAQTDEVSKTADYDRVCLWIRALAAKQPRRLIETLAEDAAATLLTLTQAIAVEVEVRKFIVPGSRWVSVHIRRERSAAAGIK